MEPASRLIQEGARAGCLIFEKRAGKLPALLWLGS
jgi:hypothetical protein